MSVQSTMCIATILLYMVFQPAGWIVTTNYNPQAMNHDVTLIAVLLNTCNPRHTLKLRAFAIRIANSGLQVLTVSTASG